MKNIIKSAVLVGLLTWVAPAAVIIVDFTTVQTPINITAPGSPPTALDLVTGVPTQTVGTVSLGYDPDDIALGRCGFDAGQGGTQFTFDCVGAHVDSAGVLGTTEGVYTFQFSQPVARLQFNYGMTTVLPDVQPEDYQILGSFSLTGSPNPPDDVVVSGDVGAFDFNRSVIFDHAEFRFFPSAPFDPGGGLPLQVGQSLAQMFDVTVTSVPEPDTLLLLVAGLGAILASKGLRRVGRK